MKNKYIVTGGLGFIGSNIIEKLNKKNITNIIIIDNFKKNKKKNLQNLKFTDIISKKTFLNKISNFNYFGNINTIFHQGACSDTTNSDKKYMLENNFLYSKKILEYAQQINSKFIYASSASVYGNSQRCIEKNKYENSLNYYSLSKLKFDQHVRKILLGRNNIQIVGLRYFNVYGKNEEHKGKMSSVIYHFNNQIKKNGVIKLFEGFNGIENGEQKRDFIYIDDIVKINLWFNKNNISGIFNAGTGNAISYNKIANSIIKFHKIGKIQYISFPKKLKNQYQNYTKSNNSLLIRNGYKSKFTSFDLGVKKYLNYLNNF